MSLCFGSSTKAISLFPSKLSKFRAFSHLVFSDSFEDRLSGSEKDRAWNTTQTSGSDIENSIFTILTIDRWETLNYMEYRLASLRPVHGKLALKFLNWVIQQPGLQLNHLTHIFCITTHVLVRARMYDSAKSILRHLSQMGVGTNSVFSALMNTYPLCNSNPAVFDLLIRVLVRDKVVEDAVETFRLMGFRGLNPSVYTCNMILAALVKDQKKGFVWLFFKEILARGICPNKQQELKRLSAAETDEKEHDIA